MNIHTVCPQIPILGTKKKYLSSARLSNLGCDFP